MFRRRGFAIRWPNLKLWARGGRYGRNNLGHDLNCFAACREEYCCTQQVLSKPHLQIYCGFQWVLLEAYLQLGEAFVCPPYPLLLSVPTPHGLMGVSHAPYKHDPRRWFHDSLKCLHKVSNALTTDKHTKQSQTLSVQHFDKTHACTKHACLETVPLYVGNMGRWSGGVPPLCAEDTLRCVGP